MLAAGVLAQTSPDDFFSVNSLIAIRDHLLPALWPMVFAFAITGILVPLMIVLSRRLGVLAIPGERHPHSKPMPLLGGLGPFMGLLPPMPTTTRVEFAPDVQNVQRGMTPRIYGRSYAIEAQLHVPDKGAEGVIVANADFIGGYGLWVDHGGRLNRTYSCLGVDSYRQTSTEKIPAGDVTVTMLFEADEPKPGTGGNVTLWADGRQIGQGRIEHTVPFMFTSYAGLDIGRDNGLVADLAYEDKAPYPFTGAVKKVTFDLKPTTHDDERALHEHAHMQAIGHGAAG